MYLQWFMDKTTNKVIKIESVHSNGELGISTKLVVTDSEIEKQEYWDGFKMKINNGDIILYFENCEQSTEEGCGHILEFYRSNQVVSAISLPEGDDWDLTPKTIGYAQY